MHSPSQPGCLWSRERTSMPWNPSGCPLAAPEELRRERSPAWSHSWDGPRSLFPPTQGALNLSQGMQGWGLEMEKCLAKEPTLELMALTFISPYAVLLQHLQMSQPLRVTGTHPIKRDLLEWVFFSLPLDFFFFFSRGGGINGKTGLLHFK